MKFLECKNMINCTCFNRKQIIKSDEDPTLHRKGWILKSSKLPILLNLCTTLILVISTTVYFQMKLIWAENNISNLENDLNWLRNELVQSAKSISKRSTPMTVIQQQLVSDATTQGVESVLLEGGVLMQHIGEGDNVTGRIGPWSYSSGDNKNQFLDLKKRNTEIRIKLKGLYFIYAQMTYMTSEVSNSFEIMTYKGNNTRRKDHRTLTVCSQTNAVHEELSFNEISCYTSVAAHLDSEDRIYINQVEANRHINFRKGYSYFGILKMKEEN